MNAAQTLESMAGESKRSVLLVEDDPGLAQAIIEELDRRGCCVNLAPDGAQGIAAARQQQFDLLIVDRMLPEVDGLSMIQLLQREQILSPVLIISALGEVDDRVEGLEAGADDYLTKPFSFAEMGARVDALLRRPSQLQATLLRAGRLSLDLLKRTAYLDGECISLSSREFQLLEYFIRRPGQLITRDMLLEQVWQLRFSPQTNVVDVHISKLRRKIDLQRDGSFIRNVRGTGFMFDAEN